MKTIIHTAQGKNPADWRGFAVYITRTPQRYSKYYAPWNNLLAPTGRHSEQIILGRKGEYLSFLDEAYKDKKIRYFLGGLAKNDEVTILCFCNIPEKCHRTIFAKWLVEKMPEEFELGELK